MNEPFSPSHHFHPDPNSYRKKIRDTVKPFFRPISVHFFCFIEMGKKLPHQQIRIALFQIRLTTALFFEVHQHYVVPLCPNNQTDKERKKTKQPKHTFLVFKCEMNTETSSSGSKDFSS